MIIVRLLSPGPWLVGTTKVYPGPGSRHCHGINYTNCRQCIHVSVSDMLISPAVGVAFFNFPDEPPRRRYPRREHIQSLETPRLPFGWLIPSAPGPGKQFPAHGSPRNDNYPQVSPPWKRQLGIYFASRRSLREGDSPNEPCTGSPANRCGTGWVVQRNPDQQLSAWQFCRSSRTGCGSC